MSSQFLHNIKCWQCSHPSQLHASTTTPLSPTLTVLSEGRPCIQCQRYVWCVLFPHLWAVLLFCLISLCAFTVTALKMSLSVSWLLISLLPRHHACTDSPRGRICSVLYRTTLSTGTKSFAPLIVPCVAYSSVKSAVFLCIHIQMSQKHVKTMQNEQICSTLHFITEAAPLEWEWADRGRGYYFEVSW